MISNDETFQLYSLIVIFITTWVALIAMSPALSVSGYPPLAVLSVGVVAPWVALIGTVCASQCIARVNKNPAWLLNASPYLKRVFSLIPVLYTMIYSYIFY